VPDVKHSISMDTPPDHVYPLISSGSGFSSWWAADFTDHESKRMVKLGFFDRATIFRLKLVRATVPFEAEWRCETGGEWQGTKLLFLLQETGGRTLLRFSHAGWQQETDYFVSCNTTWGELMYRLKATAEGRPRGPLFSVTGFTN